MSECDSGQLGTVVTKLECAQRQIDSAIRMTFLNEDVCAIHTIAAAAYRVLRDLKKKLGGSELVDMWRRYFYAAATDFLAGRLAPGDPILDVSWLLEVIKLVSNKIQNGDISNPKDLNVTFQSEKSYWNNFNAVANYLKHADSDAESVILLENLNNDVLIAQIIQSYADITGVLTSEMTVFAYYVLGSDERLGVPGWSQEMNASFRKMSPSMRRKRCLGYARHLKRELGTVHELPLDQNITRDKRRLMPHDFR